MLRSIPSSKKAASVQTLWMDETTVPLEAGTPKINVQMESKSNCRGWKGKMSHGQLSGEKLLTANTLTFLWNWFAFFKVSNDQERPSARPAYVLKLILTFVRKMHVRVHSILGTYVKHIIFFFPLKKTKIKHMLISQVMKLKGWWFQVGPFQKARWTYFFSRLCQQCFRLHTD